MYFTILSSSSLFLNTKYLIGFLIFQIFTKKDKNQIKRFKPTWDQPLYCIKGTITYCIKTTTQSWSASMKRCHIGGREAGSLLVILLVCLIFLLLSFNGMRAGGSWEAFRCCPSSVWLLTHDRCQWTHHPQSALLSPRSGENTLGLQWTSLPAVQSETCPSDRAAPSLKEKQTEQQRRGNCRDNAVAAVWSNQWEEQNKKLHSHKKNVFKNAKKCCM